MLAYYIAIDGKRILKSYNLCQKSWYTCVISAAHLVVSPSPPQNNVVMSNIVFGGGEGFPSFDMDKKIIFIRNYGLLAKIVAKINKATFEFLSLKNRDHFTLTLYVALFFWLRYALK